MFIPGILLVLVRQHVSFSLLMSFTQIVSREGSSPPPPNGGHVIRIRKSKQDRRYNGQWKMNNDLQNITWKTKDRQQHEWWALLNKFMRKTCGIPGIWFSRNKMFDIWNWIKAMVQHSDLYVKPWYKLHSYIFGI